MPESMAEPLQSAWQCFAGADRIELNQFAAARLCPNNQGLF
jgi:hypothetical protein